MLKVSYTHGVQCKRCGDFIVSVSRFQKNVYCQNCGELLMTMDFSDMSAELACNAKEIVIKETRKHWFSFTTTYEVVRDA